MLSFLTKITGNNQSFQSALPDIASETDKPLAEGKLVPSFVFKKENWLNNGSETSAVKNDTPLRELSKKPLIIVFYSVNWNGHGVALLKRVQKLLDKAKWNGNIVVVGPDSLKKLEKVSAIHGLSLNFYSDQENVLAAKFGVYSEEKPVWRRYSGIETNIPLLSLFLINRTGQVTYTYIDDFSVSASAQDLLEVVGNR